MPRCFIPNASRSASVTFSAVERYRIVSSMSSSPGRGEAQPDNKWRSTKRCRSRSTASNPTKRGNPGMDERDVVKNEEEK